MIRFSRWIPRVFFERPLGSWSILMLGITGLSIVTGISSPNRITEQLEPSWLWRAFGGISLVTAIILMFGMIKHHIPTEKLGLRLLSLSITTYVGWVVVVAGLDAIVTAMIGLSLVFFAEIRIAVIRRVINWLPPDTESKADE